LKLIFVEQNSS